MITVLVDVPASLDVLATKPDGSYVLGQELVYELSTRLVEYPDFPCPDGGHMILGGRVVNGRKLVHAILYPRTLDPVAELDSLFLLYGLDWNLLHAQEYATETVEVEPEVFESQTVVLRQMTEADALNWLADVPVLDAEGNVTGTQRPTEARLNIYLGAAPWGLG